MTHVAASDDVVNPNATAEEKPPLSFVIGKPGGKLHKEQRRLVMDFRRAMEPLTATKLHVKKSNRLQDFVNVAGPLGVTQMIMFSASELGTYMRVVRRRRGRPRSCPCLGVRAYVTETYLARSLADETAARPDTDV